MNNTYTRAAASDLIVSVTKQKPMSIADQPFVSVIIPCYNQGRFLGEAIESVLRQTYSPFEIVVVDDGSTDHTSVVAAGYRQVRLIRQTNQGLAAARNAGLRESRGGYLVFLDADDLLLPDALRIGVDCLQAHPQCAFVSGHYNLIKSDGSPITHSRRPCTSRDHFSAFLRVNYIGMNATVTYRRSVLESLGGFNRSLDACEDYELYLRIARRFPVHCHDKIVADYRQHSGNMSSDHALMLRTSISVLRSQWTYVKGNQDYEKAFKDGIGHWREYFGEQLVKQLRNWARSRQWKELVRGILVLLRYHPRRVARIILNRVQPVRGRATTTHLAGTRNGGVTGKVSLGDSRPFRPKLPPR